METNGWIVMAFDTGEMALVHPLTRVQIPLPHQNISECYDEFPMDPLIFVKRVVLSSPPKPKNETDCVVTILHGGMSHIGFSRPGDKKWTVVENNRKCGNQSLEYYRGKIYTADYSGEVWECNLIGKSDESSPILPRKNGVNFASYTQCRQVYLVESADSLLAII